jgi:hypothetical protein
MPSSGVRPGRSYRDAFDAILTGLIGEAIRLKAAAHQYLLTGS